MSKNKKYLVGAMAAALFAGGAIIYINQSTSVPFFNAIATHNTPAKAFTVSVHDDGIFNKKLLRDIQTHEVEQFNKALSVAFNDDPQLYLENNSIRTFKAVKQAVIKRGILSPDGDVVKNIDWIIKALELRIQELPKFQVVLKREIEAVNADDIHSYKTIINQLDDYKTRRNAARKLLAEATARHDKDGVRIEKLITGLNEQINNHLSANGINGRDILNVNEFLSQLSLSTKPVYHRGVVVDEPYLKISNLNKLFVTDDKRELAIATPVLSDFLALNNKSLLHFKADELDLESKREWMAGFFDRAKSVYGKYPVELKSDAKVLKAVIRDKTSGVYDVDTGKIKFKSSYVIAKKWQAYLTKMGVSNKQLVAFADASNIIVAVEEKLSTIAARDAKPAQIKPDGSVIVPGREIKGSGVVVVGISGQLNSAWKARLFRLDKNGDLLKTPVWSANLSVPYYQSDLSVPIYNISKYIS